MNAIEVENVSKKYVLHREKPTLLKDIFLRPFKRHNTTEDFWALKDISFGVKKGEAVGIIGDNGAGKSTLLKILTGITKPTSGAIKVNGRLCALLELGAGFHPDLTGGENVYLNGSVLGLSKKVIDKKFNEIVDFSGIGEFIDAPVRTYSSGMFVRLGFAVAINMEPDILLIDEVLAVGDAQFQTKCFKKITDFKREGKTIILVTHDMRAISRYTERVIFLSKGSIYCVDIPKNVVNKYLAMTNGSFEDMESQHKRLSPVSKDPETVTINKEYETEIDYDLCIKKKNYNKNEFRYGNGAARIIDFELLNNEEKEITHINCMETVIFRVKVRFYDNVKGPVFGITIKTKDGVEIYGTNTLYKGINIGAQVKGDELCVDSMMKFCLQTGDYFFSIGVADMVDENIIPLDRRYDMAYVSVLPKDKSFGIVNMNADIKVYHKNKDIKE